MDTRRFKVYYDTSLFARRSLAAFKPHVQSCGNLPIDVKRILRKLSFNRTEEEVEIVLQIAKKMKCFDRYPMYVKRELAKVLYYDEFDKGRIIIKQGKARQDNLFRKRLRKRNCRWLEKADRFLCVFIIRS